MENYLNVKKRIFSLCEKAVVNADDKYAEDIIEAWRLLTFTPIR